MGVHGLADRVRVACFVVSFEGYVLVNMQYQFQQSVQMTVVVPCLQFIDKVGHSCMFSQCKLCKRPSSFPGVALGPVFDMPVVVAQMQSPMVLTVQKNIEIFQLQSIERWSTSLLGRSSRFHVCCLHASYSFLDNVVDMPVVFNDRCPYLSVHENCEGPAVALLL